MRLRNWFCLVLGAGFVVLGAMCVWTRTRDMSLNSDGLYLAAAALALPDGDYTAVAVTANTEVSTVDTYPDTQSADATLPAVSVDHNVYSEDPAIYDGLNTYPVIETMYSGGDTGYNNFYIKNTTGFSPDIGEYLARELPFDFKKDSDEVQVLIYHTHTSESYMFYDTGYYHEGFYSRSEDEDKNMLRVGEAIADSLRQNGIGVIHATEVHDYPQYNGAYSRSRATVERYMAKYPDIKVVLDIHRDSISHGDDMGKVKPTFTHNGNKAAQIMIMSGYDGDGSLGFDIWEDNLSFALKLQDTAENLYPGMTRPLYFGNFAYNMDICEGSLLIEMGTDGNTLEEAVYSGKLLGNVLSKVLQSG